MVSISVPGLLSVLKGLSESDNRFLLHQFISSLMEVPEADSHALPAAACFEGNRGISRSISSGSAAYAAKVPLTVSARRKNFRLEVVQRDGQDEHTHTAGGLPTLHKPDDRKCPACGVGVGLGLNYCPDYIGGPYCYRCGYFEPKTKKKRGEKVQ